MKAAAKLAWGQSGYLSEAGGKMALAAKAAGLCHVGQRDLACYKKPLGPLGTSPQHVAMRAKAK
jgi:hypothetical protein